MLRYPGGKSRLLKKIVPRIKARIGGYNYAEVMVGGGSIALKMGEAFPDRRILLNDVDPDVANVWAVVSGQKGKKAVEALVDRVEASRGPTNDKVNGFAYWKEVQKSKPTGDVDRAFWFVFLNKTTYGGQVDASPVSGWNQDGWEGSNGRRVYCQYNVDNIIKEIRKANQILAGRTEVTCCDVVEALRRLPGDYLAYIDPPYFPGKNNKLYRFEMPMAKHEDLALFLEQWQRPWVLSYDEHPDIRRLYAWATFELIEANYSHGPGQPGKEKKWKSGTELLVLPKGMETAIAPVAQTPTPEPVLSKVNTRAKRSVLPEITAPEAVDPVFALWVCFTPKGQVIPATTAGSKERSLALGQECGSSDVRAVTVTERR